MSDQLPPAEVSYPTCGACTADTDHDGYSFSCYGCGLGFDTDDLTAFRLEPDLPVCGSPCSNSWHAPRAIRADISHACGTCLLTKGHAADHYTACQPVEIEAES